MSHKTTSRGIAPDGPNVPGLLRRIKHHSETTWECRVCRYKPNVDKRSKFCLNCGRDFWGNPGTIPTDATRDGT